MYVSIRCIYHGQYDHDLLYYTQDVVIPVGLNTQLRATLYACFMPCLIQLFFEKFV